ncbi:NAD/NADP octopine/nopaline dehydrogenase family protein [Microvirga brassicacearum]|uniref:2-dehydropantoate 2-reductase n=1 Tax=Microvirga brassicacearum TaxID=2580413 RepID=A0A5N3PHM0_9HYPH|nr:NAD/NADP octopine/nopaline dehydrogenase family protein [Microvirga brassicacearum]KAB0269228.1 NAD/NADP octopine/nopaline dehydrogenase [Microvirga brassicacearum]
MRVAIAGAGGIAFAAAAFLIENGHDPILWSPSGKRTTELAAGQPLTATGAVSGTYHPRVASSAAELVQGSDVILIALPAYGHRAVMDAVAPHVTDGQVVIISSHASFCALYLSKKFAERGVKAPIVAWGTTVTTGRQKSLTEVHISTVRGKIDMATVPLAASEQGLAMCQALFGDRFVQKDDLLAIALSNLNPQNHMGIALCNLTRMERGEAWGQHQNVTDAVGRLFEALDAERLRIAETFDLSVRTVREHYHFSYGVPMGPVGEMALKLHERGGGPMGPTTLDTRYVTEDAPFGLLPTVLLGKLTDAPARLHEAGLDIFSALYGRDFRQENDLLPELGLEALSKSDMQRLAREGWSSRSDLR